MIKHTGVFATEPELAEILKLREVARSAPVMKVGPMWVHEETHETFMDAIDRCAVKHGLPEPVKLEPSDETVNHYGMSNDREFTVYVPDATQHKSEGPSR